MNKSNMDSPSRKIFALVVTRNRKDSLLRCLSGILSQTVPVSSILVIDNDSHDGTYEYINQQAQVVNSDKVKWSLLHENLGGAGGFSLGVKQFLESEMDYIWMMDDDGYPCKNCLERLLERSNQNSFAGSVVLSTEDKNSISFPFRLPNSLTVMETYDRVRKLNVPVIDGVVLPFNGTLVSREVVLKIGFPRADFFIWGDEVDYAERARLAKADVFTVVDAIFYHPKAPKIGAPMFFNLLRFNDPQEDLKLYCYCRNNFYNQSKYKGYLRGVLFLFKVLWYYSFTSPSLRKLSVVIPAFFESLSRKFDGHKKYLKGHN